MTFAGRTMPACAMDAEPMVRFFAFSQMTEAGTRNSTSIDTEPSKVSRAGSIVSWTVSFRGIASLER